MALSEIGNPAGQAWQCKQVEKEEYCLFCNKGKQIVTGKYFSHACYID